MPKPIVLKTLNNFRKESRDKETPVRAGFWSRLLVFSAMALVLAAAGLLSATTAMRIAIRGQEVVVPSLEGIPQVDAARLLTETDLGLEVSGRRFSDTAPEGRVLDQTPGVGTRVKRGRNVRVLLSLGKRSFPVPELGGSSFRSAQILLNQRGMSIGNTTYSHTPDGIAATVRYQSPEAGETGDNDPNVSVLVSLGLLGQGYVMPDLTGQSLDEVVRLIRNEGFRLGPVTYTSQVGSPSGRVLQQQPLAGYKISKDGIVLLEVSQ